MHTCKQKNWYAILTPAALFTLHLFVGRPDGCLGLSFLDHFSAARLGIELGLHNPRKLFIASLVLL